MASFNVKQADWYGSHLAVALDTVVGDIFYVSEGGLDTNDGTTQVEPLLTITAAHDLCTAGDNDYIIVMDYNIDNGEAAWPIHLTKSDVHIIGTLKSAAGAPSNFVVNTAGDTFSVEADRIEIAGLSLGADGATGACITTDGGYYAQLRVHHCDLGHNTTCQDGILCSNQSWNWRVDNCRFGQDTAGIVRDGIRHAQQAGRMHVHDNVFYVRDPGRGIDFLNANFGGIIERNTFKVPDVSDGEAIYIGAYVTVGCTINNNWVCSGVESLDNNPYRDISTTANHWGLNYSGLVPTYPICV